MIFPNAILLLFLIVAAYHFGKEDTVFFFRKKFFISECLFFLKGSTVIVAPLLFKKEETYEIFRTLNFKVFEAGFFNNEFLIGLLCLGFLSSMYISKKENTSLKGVMIMDFLSLIHI